jgi:short-subunit dehydrogenase
MMSSEEVADHILTALKRKKHQLILTFQGKAIVWTGKIFYRLLDKVIYKHFAKEPDSPLS